MHIFLCKFLVFTNVPQIDLKNKKKKKKDKKERIRQDRRHTNGHCNDRQLGGSSFSFNNKLTKWL